LARHGPRHSFELVLLLSTLQYIELEHPSRIWVMADRPLIDSQDFDISPKTPRDTSLSKASSLRRKGTARIVALVGVLIVALALIASYPKSSRDIQTFTSHSALLTWLGNPKQSHRMQGKRNVGYFVSNLRGIELMV
jgi:hypothetical protein